MSKADDINVLAKALCDSIVHADPDDSKPWNDLHEIGRQYYRKRIKDLLLNEEVLIRLVLYRSRDDGTEVAVGGEPGASAGDSE